MHHSSAGEPGKRLKGDIQFELELSYCVPLGIPHSRFLSWSDEDQDKAIAYILRERSRCSRCGTFPEDWLELDENGREVHREPLPFKVHQVRCLGCAEMHDADEGVPKDVKHQIHLSFRKNVTGEEEDQHERNDEAQPQDRRL